MCHLRRSGVFIVNFKKHRVSIVEFEQVKHSQAEV